MDFSIFFIPKIKPFIEFYWNNGVISFFKIPGISINLEDESKFIYDTCCLMDEELSFAVLKEKLSTLYPLESKFLEQLLSVLNNEYLLEDKAINQNYLHQKHERVAKNIEFLGAYCQLDQNKYELQSKLSGTKVTILGLGGVGSNVLLNLAALGVRNFKIVDFDIIELSNLNRQILYAPIQIGQYKCDTAKSNLSKLFPDTSIESVNKKISNEIDIEEILSGQDFVISAADIPRDKILDWVNKTCIKYSIPFICGGIDSQWATYFSIIPHISGCVECWKIAAQKDGILYKNILHNKYFRSASLPNIAIMPMCSIVAGLISNEFLKITTKISEPQGIGKLNAFDFIDNTITVKEIWSKNPQCPVCNIL